MSSSSSRSFSGSSEKSTHRTLTGHVTVSEDIKLSAPSSSSGRSFSPFSGSSRFDEYSYSSDTDHASVIYSGDEDTDSDDRTRVLPRSAVSMSGARIQLADDFHSDGSGSPTMAPDHVFSSSASSVHTFHEDDAKRSSPSLSTDTDVDTSYSFSFEDEDERQALIKQSYIESKMELISRKMATSNQENHDIPEFIAAPLPTSKESERFCRRKLNMLRKHRKVEREGLGPQNNNSPVSPSTPREGDGGVREGDGGVRDGDGGVVLVPGFGRLMARNALEKAEAVVKEKIHRPSKCTACCEQMAQLQNDRYIERVTGRLMKDIVERDLDEAIYTKTSINMIGEIAASLPKLSCPPKEIWRQLHKGMTL